MNDFIHTMDHVLNNWAYLKQFHVFLMVSEQSEGSKLWNASYEPQAFCVIFNH